MSLSKLRSALERRKLKGKKVIYRVRWSDEDRGGTITRVSDMTIWIGCFVYNHKDLTALEEIE